MQQSLKSAVFFLRTAMLPEASPSQWWHMGWCSFSVLTQTSNNLLVLCFLCCESSWHLFRGSWRFSSGNRMWFEIQLSPIVLHLPSYERFDLAWWMPGESVNLCDSLAHPPNLTLVLHWNIACLCLENSDWHILETETNINDPGSVITSLSWACNHRIGEEGSLYWDLFHSSLFLSTNLAFKVWLNADPTCEFLLALFRQCHFSMNQHLKLDACTYNSYLQWVLCLRIMFREWN